MKGLDLGGRTIAITGSTGGLGEGLSQALRGRKANLVLMDLDAAAVAEQAERLGGERVAFGVEADVRSLDSMNDAMARAAEHFGRLDVVIAGAGISKGSNPLSLLDVGDWEKTIDVNLNGVVRTFKAALPHVLRQRGHMVAISSMAAFIHNPLAGAYPASKAGVWALCDTLRLELAHQGVTVASAHPTYFKTPMMERALERPAMKRLMNNYEGMWALTSIDVVIDELVRGIERREAHIIAPRNLRLVAMAPGFFGPFTARRGFPGNAIAEATELARLEAEAAKTTGPAA